MNPTPTRYDRSTLFAVRALFDGVANEGQQKMVVRWLVDKCCHAGEPSYRADQTETAFREGERHVGVQLVTMVTPQGLKNLEDFEASVGSAMRREAGKRIRTMRQAK